MARQSRVAALALAATVALCSGAGAQSLAISLFERYLEPLRIQAGIPGLSAVIIQDGQIVWERGFGMADVENSIAARPDTPYGVADLTQTFTTVLLAQCAQWGLVQPEHQIRTWVPQAADPPATIRQVLMHTANSSGTYRYEPARFALLTAVVEGCMQKSYQQAIAQSILGPANMVSSVPGRGAPAPPPPDAEAQFDERTVDRYAGILQRLAVPYKVDKGRRATRSEQPPPVIDASYGLIASARDLANYDLALGDQRLVRADTLAQIWANPPANGGKPHPMALGWFVQTYEGQPIVWHFGLSTDAYSALILKVPTRRLTLILLANSDGLSAGFSLPDGDVATSIFARTFLRVFL
jgi:CubicO group peptidase (beta-lactamase class C family)